MSILRGQESPKREFIDFLEHVNDTFTKLLEEAPTLNRSAYKILNEKRRSKPSPFEIIEKRLGYNNREDFNNQEDFEVKVES